MRETQEVIFELPIEGPVSWATVNRCAREAGMPVGDWVGDAIAAYVRFHEEEISRAQRQVWPLPQQEKRPVPRWKLRLGETLLLLGERCLDDGCEI